MKAEIITIGTELLMGGVDTNSAYLGRQLFSIGVEVVRKVSVGDDEAELENAIQQAIARADLVITTGGLGPTVDDITKPVAVKLLKKRLILNERQMERVKSFFAFRKERMPHNNISQAMIPQGAKIIENNEGTAPGLIMKVKNKHLVLLPGPPNELHPMVEKTLLPFLKQHAHEKQVIKSRILKVCGLPESVIDEKIAGIFAKDKSLLAILPSVTEIHVKITVRAKDEKKGDQEISGFEEKIREKLGEHIFGSDDETMENVVGSMLRQAGKTVSVAESCTGGLLGQRLTSVPGSSDYFKGGMTAYSNEVKMKLLKVPPDAIRIFGAVSKEVAEAMAENVRKIMETDFGLGITGIAGPDGGTAEKPVGLVHIVLSAEGQTFHRECRFTGTREAVRLRASQVAMNMLRLFLMKK